MDNIRRSVKEAEKYADFYTLEDFLEAVDSGNITCWDGHGYYVKGANETTIQIDFENLGYDFDGVMWYNK